MKTRCAHAVVCPKCKSEWTLTSFWVVLFQVENWALGSGIGIGIALLARLLEWSAAVSLGAAVAAALPLFFCLVRKSWCSVCEIEFVDEQPPESFETPVSPGKK